MEEEEDDDVSLNGFDKEYKDEIDEDDEDEIKEEEINNSKEQKKNKNNFDLPIEKVPSEFRKFLIAVM